MTTAFPTSPSETVVDQTVQLRRRLHRRPELSFEEEETRQFILETLEELGIEGERVAGTGVVATIRGTNGDGDDGDGSGGCVALRAELDALPVNEEPTPHNEGFISEHDGYMHACGHDAHMAMLVGTARALVEAGAPFRGNVKLIFQPAEERPPGGAVEMVEEGALRDPAVDAIFALHIFGNLPLNSLSFTPGPIMAGVENFRLAVRGVGGHAAYPHLAVNPIDRAAALVREAATIVPQTLAPTTPAVISFGMFNGGTANNIIPDEVALEGTMRALDERVMAQLKHRLEEAAQCVPAPANTASSSALEAPEPAVHIDYRSGYPPTVNDPTLAAWAETILEERFGGDIDPQCTPVMGAEDFAYYARAVPALFMFLGTHDPGQGLVAFNHSPRFGIDERVLERGVSVYLQLLAHWFDTDRAPRPIAANER